MFGTSQAPPKTSFSFGNFGAQQPSFNPPVASNQSMFFKKDPAVLKKNEEVPKAPKREF